MAQSRVDIERDNAKSTAYQIYQQLEQRKNELNLVIKKKNSRKFLLIIIILSVSCVVAMLISIYLMVCLVVFLILVVLLPQLRKICSWFFSLFLSSYDREISRLRTEIEQLESQYRMSYNKAIDLENAKNMEVAGRFEDAASIYEHYGLYEEAGIARKKGRTIYVEQRTVDINTLLEQLKSESRSVNYRCPNCGAIIKITGFTTATYLTRCEYCGSEIKLHDVVEVLQNILGK